MRGRRAAIAAVLIGLSSGLSAQETVTIVDTYCDGEGCPTKYMIEGFEVRVATSVYDAPDFSHSQLGQALDKLQAELIAFERMARRPPWNQLSIVRPDRSVSVSTFGFRPHPVNQLRTAGVSFYIQSDHHVANAYSNCTGACYISRPKRIVLNIGRLLQLIYTDLVVVHELAHAYHDVALEDGTANACVEKAYEIAVTNGGLYATVDNWQPFQEPGNPRALVTKVGYAGTNKYEYFAVNAESYLALRSEDYPYDRADLLEYDLTGFLLQWGVWEANDPTIALSTECGMTADLPGGSGDFPAVIREPTR